MKNSLLISSKYKVWGWIGLIVFSCTGLLVMYGNFNPPFFVLRIGGNDETSLLRTISLIGVIIALLIICFSREEKEDEYISFIRLKSWQWAVLTSYLLLAIASAVIYGFGFLSIMLYNMFTIPIVFIAKFNYSLYKLKRERLDDEK